MGTHVFYTVVVDGAVIDTHESTDDSDEQARAAAIASADALAGSGDRADVYRHGDRRDRRTRAGARAYPRRGGGALRGASVQLHGTFRAIAR